MKRKQKIEQAARLLQNCKGVKVLSEKEVIHEVKRLVSMEVEGYLLVDDDEIQKEYYLLGLNNRNGIRTLAFEKYKG